MSLPIAIPTKNRAGDLKSLQFFPKATLFVEPKELNAYRAAHPESDLVDIGANDRGIAFVRNFILNHYAPGRVLFADDDITDLYVRGRGCKLKPLSAPEDLVRALNECLARGYSQATISYGPSNWMFRGAHKTNTRAWCLWAIDCSLTARCDPGAVPFEDYDLTAQILRAGRKNISLFRYAFACVPMATNAGGLQSYDRLGMMAPAAQHLQRKWGDLVRLVHNKTRNVTEVQFQWSKIAAP